MRLALGTLLLSLTLLPACGKDPAETDTDQTGTGTGTATTGTATTGTTATTGEPTSTTSVTGTGTGTSTPGTTTDGTTAGTTTDGTTAVTTAGETGTTTTGTTTTGTTTDGTTGDTGVIPPGGECVDDGDCTLHNDCCDCFAVAAPDELPICKKGCEQKTCERLEISAAVCRFGVCVTEKVPCDPQKVACDSLPPDCPKGEVASVKDGCWSGQCVPAISCDVVPSCDLCPDGFMCVFMEAQIPMPLGTCEPIPAQCDDKIDCGCAGTQACVNPFDACNKVGDNELHCACPAC